VRKVLLFFSIVLISVNITYSQKKVIRAVVLKDFPPLYSLDKNGNPIGFAIDVLKNVSDKAGYNIQYLIVENWADALNAIRKGNADLIPGIGISVARKAEFDFSEKIEVIPVSCFVRKKDFHITSFKELQGHRIAVITKSAAYTKLKRDKTLNLIELPNIDSAILKLLAGDADALIFSEPVLLKKLRLTGLTNEIKVIDKPIINLKRGFLYKKNSKLLSVFDPFIRKYTGSKEYLYSYKRWYGTPDPFWTINRILIFLSSFLVLIIISIIIWRTISINSLNKKLLNTINIKDKAEKILQLRNEELSATTEELLDSQNELLKINNEKDTLLKEIHHRVKNNMQIISGLLELQSFYINNDEAQEIFRESQNRILSMAQVHEMLYKFENLAAINFTTYLENLINHIRDSYNLNDRISFKINSVVKNINIDIAVPCALLINELLSNIIKHAFDEGQNGVVNISFQLKGDSYFLEVTDNGKGIGKVDLQGEQKTLGLSLIQSLVSQLNGEMAIINESGTKVLVSFSEKINESPQFLAESIDKDSKGLNKKVILIVEDEVITATFLKRVLEDNDDYQVYNVSSGEEVFSFFKEITPDLIIMDIMLKGAFNGIEITKKINENYNVPVIYSTANSDSDILSSAQRTQPMGFLTKPIRRSEFVRLVSKTLKV